jgi:filamentous hemagglutinin family protein
MTMTMYQRRSSMTRRHSLRWHALAHALATAFAAPAMANPAGPVVVNGAASISGSGKSLTVTNTPGAILNWNSFSIGADESVRFQQQNAASQVLNRVTGGDPSKIAGVLSSNGRVFLINPNGIVFAPGSQVNVAGLVASTLNLSNDDFLAGRLRFQEQPGAGKITSQGTIQTVNGGKIYLVAPSVENTGILVAPDGDVILAAGKSVSLVDASNPEISVELTASENRALNLGQIVAHNVSLLAGVIQQSGEINANAVAIGDGGHVILTATQTADVDSSSRIRADGPTGGSITIRAGEVAAVGGYLTAIGTDGQGGQFAANARTILQSGQVDVSGQNQGGSIDLIAGHRIVLTSDASLIANGVTGDGGKITVQALSFGDPAAGEDQRSRIFGSPTIQANGSAGGEIKLLADDIYLLAAQVNAKGVNQGGTVLIGGDMQGRNPDVPNAVTTSINTSSSIDVSALGQGNGGKSIVWSDQTTQFSGTVLAKGGANGGNGGFVEISGKDTLHFAGSVDASARLGTSGTLLLDPKNITIDAAGSVPAYDLLDPNPGTANQFGKESALLPNGNAVVTAPGTQSGMGAVYLFNTQTGALISALSGSHQGDTIGNRNITVLTNGNYVIPSPNWENGTATNAGAVTWANASTGISGLISSNNSLVGTQANDYVGANTYGLSYNTITPLANGNYVVSSSVWANGTASKAGAVTWGNGNTGISGTISAANSLVGTQANDQIGSGFVTPLPNGNYVVGSPNWANGTATNAGAATWGNGATGITGIISSANSLIGTTYGDEVGSKITALANGNYAVASPNWTNGFAQSAGAVTWGNGNTGVNGAISSSNSLVGSTSYDQVGFGYYGVTSLANGNYVVSSRYWNDNGAACVGAATWGNGTTGITGVITVTNSLIGSTMNDTVGAGVTALANGNYVVSSPSWTNGTASYAGAVTWGNGSTGISGTVSAANSVVGTQAYDQVGSNFITPLPNGNYVIASPHWANGTARNAGAATWGNGTAGTIGAVSSANSLIGTQTNDYVGVTGVVALSNSNYVVVSESWANGSSAYAGAVTWANGTTGITGPVSATNSLVGSHSGDSIGVSGTGNNATGVFALTNGNFVVTSPYWTNGTVTYAGAVTWANGTTGIKGAVSTANSLVGTRTNDYVGYYGVRSLPDGNYVVASPYWTNGASSVAGAVTWGNGNAGISGIISAANSLVGTHANDNVGATGYSGAFDTNGLSAFANGNYLVAMPYWNNGAGRVAVVNPGGSAFGEFPSTDITLSPAWISTITNTGTSVRLQANNDITVNSAIATSANGKGGDITFQAGRSININANINTDNGALTLLANDPGANPTFRDPGVGNVTMAAGTGIDVGTGLLTANANGSTGNIVFRDVIAGSIVATGNVSYLGSTTASSISFGSGSMDLGSGTALNVTGLVTIPYGSSLGISAGTLTAGSLNIGGSLSLSGGTLNAGNVTVANGATLAIASGTPNFNGGLNVDSGGTVDYGLAGPTTVLGTLNNTGTLQIRSGTLDLANGYVQTGGMTRLGTSVSAPAALVVGGSGFALNGGTLGGSGAITGNLTVGAGTVSPGFSPGSLSINGNLILSPSSITAIELGGTVPGSGYDVIHVSGSAALAGALNVSNYGGYVPAAGSSYNFLDYASVSGAFGTTTLPSGIAMTQYAAYSQLFASAASTPATSGASTSGVTAAGVATVSVLAAPLLPPPVSVQQAQIAEMSSAPGTSAVQPVIMTALPVSIGNAPSNVAATSASTPVSGDAMLPGGEANTRSAVTRYLGIDGVSAWFPNLPLASLNRIALGTLLEERRAYKRDLLAAANIILSEHPEIADLPLCREEQESDSGACLLSETLQRAAGAQRGAAARSASRLHAHLPAIARKRALVIGLNDYADKRIPRLESALPDARAMRDALSRKLGYEVTLLENPDKAQIMAAFNRLALEMSPSDSFVVYFAGHGDMVEKTGEGYWIPADASASDPRGWISNADVSRLLRLVKARQVAMISDSCYSGTFAREASLDTQAGARASAEAYLTKRAVTVMTSGSDEPVADSGKEGHSVFAWNLLDQIRGLQDWNSGASVYATVRTEVERELPQSPLYGASLSAGHQAGADFLFERRDSDE